MSDLIDQLTLGAGLNSEQKILDYLEISRSTWFRRRRHGRLRWVEHDALRHKADELERRQSGIQLLMFDS